SSALLTRVQYRPQHGPQFGVSYTLSKALRDVEDFQYFAQDELNAGADKSRASNDRRHQVVVNFNWSLPAGFDIAGLASARSGLPWNVTTGVDNNKDKPNKDRPDLAVLACCPKDKETECATITQ